MWLKKRQFKKSMLFTSLSMLLLSSFAFAYELHMFGFADPTDIKYAYRKDGIYDYSYNIP